MTRIAMISSPFDRRDGILNHVISLSKRLSERGHEVTVYGLATHAPAIDALKSTLGDSITIRGITSSRANGKFGHYAAYATEVSATIAKNHSTSPFDVVHAHSGYVIGARGLKRLTKRVPVVVTAHGVEADRFRWRLSTGIKGSPWPGAMRMAEAMVMAPVLGAMGRALYAPTDFLIASCRFVDRVARRAYGLDGRPGALVPHAVESSAFDGIPPPRSDAEPTFLYAGRLFHDKGVVLLLDAFSRVLLTEPRARLIIRGRGYLEHVLRERARALSIAHAVRFETGFTPESEWANIYREAPIFVMPSLYEPGISTALLEAMAASRVSIASDFGGLSEVIYPGEGFAVPAGSPEELARTMIDVLQAPENWARIGADASRGVRTRHDWKSAVGQVEKIYGSL